jgi:hypothetical protein
MHVLYAACARDIKNFLTEIIELDRSFSKQFEFSKLNENWVQLLDLKLYTNIEVIRNLAFWCSWCSR